MIHTPTAPARWPCKRAESHIMKAYQIITAGQIVAILFALDTADALATAKAQGITADNAIRMDY